MAATALAIRLHEADRGRRPEKLDDLVGAYMTAVPVDPFGPDEGKLRYLPGANPAKAGRDCLLGDDDVRPIHAWGKRVLYAKPLPGGADAAYVAEIEMPARL